MLNFFKSLGQTKVTAILALAIVALVVLGCNSKPDMPNDSAVQTLVKGTTSDFTDALNKGDFKALRDKASSDFQSQFTEDALKTAFKSLIDNKEDAVPVFKDAASKNPNFSPAPAMREEKGSYVLTTNGTYDTSPEKLNFNYEYVWRDGAWKLLTIQYK